LLCSLPWSSDFPVTLLSLPYVQHHTIIRIIDCIKIIYDAAYHLKFALALSVNAKSLISTLLENEHCTLVTVYALASFVLDGSIAFESRVCDFNFWVKE